MQTSQFPALRLRTVAACSALFVTLLFVSSFCTSLRGADKKDPSVTILVVSGAFEYPDVTIPILSIAASGTLEMDGEIVNDEMLIQKMRPRKALNEKPRGYLRLNCEHEADLSAETLGKVLQRIREKAKAGECDVFVYVYLRKLTDLPK